MYCIAILRDLGADITLVDWAGGGRDPSRFKGIAGQFPTVSLLAGTSKCALNLKDPLGKQAFVQMAGKADVVLEGFRPGTAKRLGIDYEALSARNQGLVYAAISGYGQGGPSKNHVGHDINYLAMAGVLELTGEPGRTPVIPGVTMGDGLAGMSAALNILAALQKKAQTGQGQFLDIAIIDGPLFLMSMEFERYWETGVSRSRGESHLTGRYPWYQVFETKDGRWISIGAVETPFYVRLCELLGRPDLASRQFAEGEDLRDLFLFFRDKFKAKTLDEWTQLLAEKDTCVSPVLTPGEAANNPQNQRMIRTKAGTSVKMMRSPVRLPEAPVPTGRNTEESLKGYGLSSADVRKLKDLGVAGE